MDTEKELTETEKIPAAAISNHTTVVQQSHMIGTRRLDKISLEAAKLRLRTYGYTHARRHYLPICMKESLFEARERSAAKNRFTRILCGFRQGKNMV